MCKLGCRDVDSNFRLRVTLVGAHRESAPTACIFHPIENGCEKRNDAILWDCIDTEDFTGSGTNVSHARSQPARKPPELRSNSYNSYE